MARTGWALALLLVNPFLFAAWAQEGKQAKAALALVDRALDASGGAQTMAALQTVTVKGHVRHWEPEQSYAAGGEMRLAGDSTFVIARDLGMDVARVEWVRKLVYPSQREYRFTEVVTPSAGYVQGVDSTSRTKQSLDSNPPHHAMSGFRLTAAQRELLRTSPRLLWLMKSQPNRLARVADVAVDGKRLGAVKFTAAAGFPFIVMFDADTGLPARVRTLDDDNIQGDSTYDLVLSDWRAVQGLKFAHQQIYELNGKQIGRIELEEVRVNPLLAAARFEIPAGILDGAPKPVAARDVPFQWVLRRQNIGVYLDSDRVRYDPQVSRGLRLAELAPGVQQVVGGTHNSLIVELDKSLVVFDAPIDEWQSRWTIDAARKRFPGKKVKYLVLTHHHMDHAGGVRTYVAEGATVVVGAGNAAHFQKVFKAPHTLHRDALQRRPRAAQVIEVANKKVLSDGKREVVVYRVDNPHAEGMLLGYVPRARLGFVADLWSPGRDKLGDKLTPGQEAIVAAVKKAGIVPERMAGGHGSVAEYPLLETVAARPQP